MEDGQILELLDSHGEIICEVEFTAEQWKQIHDAAIQLFVETAIQNAIDGELPEPPTP